MASGVSDSSDSRRAGPEHGLYESGSCPGQVCITEELSVSTSVPEGHVSGVPGGSGFGAGSHSGGGTVGEGDYFGLTPVDDGPRASGRIPGSARRSRKRLHGGALGSGDGGSGSGSGIGHGGSGQGEFGRIGMRGGGGEGEGRAGVVGGEGDIRRFFKTVRVQPSRESSQYHYDFLFSFFFQGK